MYGRPVVIFAAVWQLAAGSEPVPTPDVDTSTQTVSGTKPWAVGVSAARRTAAEARLAEGNRLFLAASYRRALDEYRAALEHYDHPAIHFNIARTLINLDRPAEAFASVEAALRYGAAPLKHLYEDATSYHRLLKAQVAEVDVSCTQPGVVVTLDGRNILDCPGARTLQLRTGNHQLVARRSGFLTLTRDLVVLPGKAKPIELSLVSIEDATQRVRPYSAWKPWAVVAGGALVSGLGVAMLLDARSTRDEYQALLRTDCGSSPCDNSGELSSVWDEARTKNAVSIVSLVAGAAITLTGVTFLYFNRSRAVLVPAQEPELELLPQISTDSVGASIRRRF